MVILIGFDERELSALKQSLVERGVQATCYRSIEELLDRRDMPPERTKLVVDLSGVDADGITLLPQVGAPSDTVIVSRPDQVSQRLSVLRSGYWKQCQKPVQIDELLGLLDIQSHIPDLRVRAGYSDQKISLPQALYEYQREQEALNQHAIVSVSDAAGNIIYVNDLFCQISGYGRGELMGCNHRIVRSNAHEDSFYREMWATISGGQAWSGVICNRRKDGSHYWVESTITPFLDHEGNPYQYVSIRTDITDVVQAQERLRRGQVYANIGTWEWNIQTGHLYWSDRIPPLFGYQEKEIETTFENFVSAVHPDDREMVLAAIDRCIEQDEPYDIEHRVLWPDGTVRWLQEKGAVVRDDKGRPLLMTGIVQDIDERKRDRIALAQRQRELNEAQSLAQIGNWSLNRKTGEVVWSDEIYRIFGYEPDQVEPDIGLFFERVHPDDRSLFERAVESHRGDDELSLTHRILLPNGSLKYVHQLAVNEFSADGTPVRLSGTVQDVTERALAEKKLNETKAQFAFAVEGAGDGVWDLNLINGEISVSRLCSTMLGYEPDEAPRDLEDWFGMIHPEDIDKVREAISGYIAGDREVYSVERRQSCKQGGYRWVLSRGTAVERDENGRPTRMIGINSDIHERKLEQHALILAREEAESANRAKSDFLSSMSHELRTPMNAILGFAQLLEYDDALTHDQCDSVQEIIRAGRHLLSLINEVLDLAKVESGRLELSVESVEIQPVIEEAVALVEPMAAKEGIGIRVGDIGGIYLDADRIRIKQVLLNLLSNAIKYNRPQGQVFLSVGREEQTGRIRIAVADTGMGIPEQQQAHLFEPFSRFHAQHVEIEGTGIGLTLTKRLVEAMGGEIGFNSSTENGSTFWFSIPEYEEDGNEEDLCSNDVASLESSASSSATLLYVDDNPANLKFLQSVISKFLPGVSLYTSASSIKGLDMALTLRPDLLLLDLSMPELDGFTFLDVLRGRHGLDLPAIAISANAMPEDVRQGMDSGFIDYLTKPLEIPVLIDVISSRLSMHDQSDVMEVLGV